MKCATFCPNAGHPLSDTPNIINIFFDKQCALSSLKFLFDNSNYSRYRNIEF